MNRQLSAGRRHVRSRSARAGAAALLGALAWCACAPGGGGAGGGDPDVVARPFGIYPAPLRQALGEGFAAGFARADMDGDQIADVVVGLLDVFTSDSQTATLSLVYLDRSGKVRETVAVEPVRFPVAIHPADLDLDGDNDLAVLDDIGEVLIFLQQPDHGFEAPVPYSVGDDPSALVAGDLDGDGTLDLLSSNRFTRDVSVLIGRGDGTYEPARFSPAGGEVGAGSAGDLDGDGKLDVVAVGSFGVELLLGLGNGRFAPPAHVPLGFQPERLVVADVVGDGALDLVTTSSNASELRVLEGDGSGSFGPSFQHTFGSSAFSDALAVADLDLDGLEDIVMGRSSALTSFVNLGNGSFRASPSFPVGSLAGWLLVGDADGDQTPDAFALTYETDGVTEATTFLVLSRGNGGGGFVGPCSYPAGSRTGVLRAGDFVVDGVPDLALATSFPSSLLVLPGVPGGGFGAPIATPLTSSPDCLLSADLDGNTLDDVVIGSGSFSGAGMLEFLSSAGNGTFDPPVAFAAGGSDPTGLAYADLDGDLVNDLVIANSRSNQIAVHLGNFDHTFQKPLRFGTGLSPSGVELADLDQDGVLDAVTPNRSDRTVSVLLGVGDGSFLPDVAHATLPGPTEVAIGDLNGDGWLDLTVACGGDFFDEDGGVQILHGLGGGGFAPPVLVHDVQTYRVEVPDVNGDGRLDLLWSGFGGFSLIVSRGNGLFTPPADYVSDFLGDLLVGDFDGDGKPDVALNAGQGETSLVVYTNQSP